MSSAAIASLIMGCDQNGNTFHDLGKHPRKELMRRLGYKKAARMFRDKKNGPPVHIGYVVGRHWITLYEVRPWEKPA